MRLQKLLKAFSRRSNAAAKVEPSLSEGEDQSPTKVWQKAAGKSGRAEAKSKVSSFRSKRARFDDGVAQIGVELENGRRLYYMIHGEKGFDRLDEEKTDRVPLVSAYCDDFRVFAQSPMSDAKAKGFAARESDALERMTVINESKRGRIYATGQSSIEADVNRVPLLSVMDELLKGRTGSFVAGIMLGEQDLVILYAFNEGFMGRKHMQVAINPSNLDAIAHSFVSMSGLPDDAEIVIFEQQELIQLLRSKAWAPYPSNQGFYGIPAKAIPKIMVGVTGAAAIATSAYAAYWYMQESKYLGLAKEHAEKEAKAIGDIGNEILARRQSFMRKTSIDVDRASNMASELRTEGALVEAAMKRDGYTFTVITPFFSTDKAGDGETYKSAIALEPKNGCTKRAIETTGGMREIKVQYVCTNPGANFSRFGW